MINVNRNGNRGKYNNAKTATYFPINKEKYVGPCNPVFKSNLEHKMMAYLDKSKKIAWWTYEPDSIWYLDKSSNPPVKRRYFIDFKFQDVSGQVYWVEIKPYSESIPPRTKDQRAVKLWLKNKSKWEAATALAESKGYKFKVLTERQLD